MPTSKPDATILLTGAMKYLEEELLPTLNGYYRFQTRVTINVLNTVRRELELRSAHGAEEAARLRAILGHEGPLDSLNDELCGRIRSGAIAADDAALHDHVRRSLADALAINNPKWTSR